MKGFIENSMIQRYFVCGICS